MIKNNTLKLIEEIILSKQQRQSIYISSLNSLFEEVYNRFKKYFAHDNDEYFNKIIVDIAEVYTIPDASFENQNLFLIKKLVSTVVKERTKDLEFFIQRFNERFFKVEIEFEPWDSNESHPKLSITPQRKEFTKEYNSWYNSPIFIDENGAIKLFDFYGDKRFGIDKEYFDTLDSAKLGTYLQDFAFAWDKLHYLCKMIEETLN